MAEIVVSPERDSCFQRLSACWMGREEQTRVAVQAVGEGGGEQMMKHTPTLATDSPGPAHATFFVEGAIEIHFTGSRDRSGKLPNALKAGSLQVKNSPPTEIFDAAPDIARVFCQVGQRNRSRIRQTTKGLSDVSLSP